MFLFTYRVEIHVSHQSKRKKKKRNEKKNTTNETRTNPSFPRKEVLEGSTYLLQT